MPAETTTESRIRIVGAITAGACLALGLGTQLLAWSPAVDALASVLYVVLIGSLVMLVAPRLPGLAVASIAFGFATAIELFQLTGLPQAIVGVIPAAHLVLGNAFDALDIVAYAGGACVVFAVRLLVSPRRAAASAR